MTPDCPTTELVQRPNDTPTELKLSEEFAVLQTQYGRACFATQDIPKGTDVLSTNVVPFGAIIIHEFRKEVCSFCFAYKYGKYCKVKLPQPEGYTSKKWLGCGLWFCSEDCSQKWRENVDQDDKLSLAFESILVNFQQKFKNNETEDDYSDKEFYKVDITEDYIDKYWEKVSEWESEVEKVRPSRRINHLPFINEDDYNTVRFVTGILFNIYRKHPSTQYFDKLQSNEVQKIQKFPVLLKSLESIYKFLKVSLPDFLQPYLSIKLVRLIVGREFGNSFGIWQTDKNFYSVEENSENKELLGYMMQPEASFFNHSCAPNLKKYRIDNRMHFQTLKDIRNGEQLCIDYFHVLEDSFQERQKHMMENWFFKCNCQRCQSESPELGKDSNV
jgi:SET and MYND domain-containing protein